MGFLPLPLLPARRRKRSEQVNQNRVISISGIEQNVEKVLVWLVHHQLTLYALHVPFSSSLHL